MMLDLDAQSLRSFKLIATLLRQSNIKSPHWRIVVSHYSTTRPFNTFESLLRNYVQKASDSVSNQIRIRDLPCKLLPKAGTCDWMISSSFQIVLCVWKAGKTASIYSNHLSWITCIELVSDRREIFYVLYDGYTFYTTYYISFDVQDLPMIRLVPSLVI